MSIWPLINQCQLLIPLLAGDNAEPLVCATADKFARLPPLVIACIRHVQNVAVFETETTARQTAVTRRIILKQCSVWQQPTHTTITAIISNAYCLNYLQYLYVTRKPSYCWQTRATRKLEPKLLQFDVPTTLSLTILSYLHAFNNNNNNTVISIALFTDHKGALTTSDICSTK